MENTATNPIMTVPGAPSLSSSDWGASLLGSANTYRQKLQEGLTTMLGRLGALPLCFTPTNFLTFRSHQYEVRTAADSEDLRDILILRKQTRSRRPIGLLHFSADDLKQDHLMIIDTERADLALSCRLQRSVIGDQVHLKMTDVVPRIVKGAEKERLRDVFVEGLEQYASISGLKIAGTARDVVDLGLDEMVS